jgi:hypothetical protein
MQAQPPRNHAELIGHLGQLPSIWPIGGVAGRFGFEGWLALCGWIPLGRCQRREQDPGMSVRRS